MNIAQSDNPNDGLSPAINFTFSEKLQASDRSVYASIFKKLAESIRQQHPELSFDRLLHIIVSDDVWETVATLEKMVGYELSAARNAAQSYLAFAVDLGHIDVLVYRLELVNGFSNGHTSKADSVWHYLSTLATIDYYTKAKARFTIDPWRAKANQAELAIFGVASDLLAHYWFGYFSYHPRSSPTAPFDLLAETVVGESQQMESAFIANGKDKDDSKLFHELHISATSVCGAMATAMGYCDAAHQSLAKTSPETWALILRWKFEDVWEKMASIVPIVFSNRHLWRDSVELLPLATMPSYFVERCGITFTSDGGTTPFSSLPLKKGNAN